MWVMRGRVLVVDDDTALAEMLGIVLRGEGFEPFFCADGAEALDAFRSSRPDLVLLDLQLPDMSGEQVLAALRASAATRDIPVIVITADIDPAVHYRILASGARGFLVKPYDITELLRAVDGSLQTDGP